MGRVVIHMVTPTVTGASRGALGAGLETQDWLLCVDAPGLELYVTAGDLRVKREHAARKGWGVCAVLGCGATRCWGHRRRQAARGGIKETLWKNQHGRVPGKGV